MKRRAGESVKLDTRRARRIKLAVAVAVLLVAGLAYLLSLGFRDEVGLVSGILARGDVSGLREYTLSFGA